MAVTFMHEGEEFTSAGTSLPLPASAQGRRGPAPTVGGSKTDGGNTGVGLQKVVVGQLSTGAGGEEKPRHSQQATSNTHTQQEVRTFQLAQHKQGLTTTMLFRFRSLHW